MKWEGKGQDSRCKAGDGDGDGIMNKNWNRGHFVILRPRWTEWDKGNSIGVSKLLFSIKHNIHSNPLPTPQHFQQLLRNRFSKFRIIDMILYFNYFN
jgi:hypothetical protein